MFGPRMSACAFWHTIFLHEFPIHKRSKKVKMTEMLARLDTRIERARATHQLACLRMGSIILVISIITNWARESSPTLGCSIEISRDTVKLVMLTDVIFNGFFKMS